MRRRTFALACATGVLGAGCTGTGTPDADADDEPPVAGSDDGSTDTTATTPTETTDAQTMTADVTVAGTSTHDAIDVSFTATVSSPANVQTPPRLELTFTNRGPEREFYFGATPPFTGITATDRALVLIPDDRSAMGTVDPDTPNEFVPERPSGGCWRSLHEPMILSYAERRRLETDEGITAGYAVLVHPDEAGCPPTGTHRFENSFGVGDVQDGHESWVALSIS